MRLAHIKLKQPAVLNLKASDRRFVHKLSSLKLDECNVRVMESNGSSLNCFILPTAPPPSSLQRKDYFPPPRLYSPAQVLCLKWVSAMNRGRKFKPIPKKQPTIFKFIEQLVDTSNALPLRDFPALPSSRQLMHSLSTQALLSPPLKKIELHYRPRHISQTSFSFDLDKFRYADYKTPDPENAINLRVKQQVAFTAQKWSKNLFTRERELPRLPTTLAPSNSRFRYQALQRLLKEAWNKSMKKQPKRENHHSDPLAASTTLCSLLTLETEPVRDTERVAWQDWFQLIKIERNDELQDLPLVRDIEEDSKKWEQSQRLRNEALSEEEKSFFELKTEEPACMHKESSSQSTEQGFEPALESQFIVNLGGEDLQAVKDTSGFLTDVTAEASQFQLHFSDECSPQPQQRSTFPSLCKTLRREHQSYQLQKSHPPQPLKASQIFKRPKKQAFSSFSFTPASTTAQEAFSFQEDPITPKYSNSPHLAPFNPFPSPIFSHSSHTYSTSRATASPSYNFLNSTIGSNSYEQDQFKSPGSLLQQSSGRVSFRTFEYNAPKVEKKPKWKPPKRVTKQGVDSKFDALDDDLQRPTKRGGSKRVVGLGAHYGR